MDKERLIPLVSKDVLARLRKMSARRYGSGDVSKLLGVPPRTMAYWSDSGLIEPGDGEAMGKGSRRYFTTQNLVEVAIMHELSKLGFGIGTLTDVKRRLTENGYFGRLGAKNREHEVAQVFVDNKGVVGLKNGTDPMMDDGYRVMVTINLPVIERYVADVIGNEVV